MPIYEYRCQACAGAFDLIRRVAQRNDAATCSDCGSSSTERVTVQRFAIAGTAANPPLHEGDLQHADDAVHGYSHGVGYEHDHTLDALDMSDEDWGL